MKRLRSARPSPALVVGLVALVAALAGVASARVIPGLSGKQKRQVTRIAIKQANRQISHRAPGLLVAGATGAQNAANADSAAVALRLASVTVERETGSVPSGSGGSVDAFCPATKQAIGGGGRADDFSAPRLLASRPTRAGGEPPSDGEAFTGWRVSVFNDTGEAVQPEAWVVCAG
jgi:hypothetical protein